MTADYAAVFEREYRPRRRIPARARRAAAYALWAVLFVIQPRLALQILRERRYRP